jgi:outer membrane protein OmpA-like peptidoglycan-associated protein
MRRKLLALALSLAAMQTVSPVKSFQEASIPLRKGLTVVTAINDPARGDYESLKRITNLSERDVMLSISGDAPPVDDDPIAALFGDKPARKAGTPESREFRIRRTVRREDLKSAHAYMQSFLEGSAETFPGSTALGVSAAVLDELKTKGQSELAIFDRRSSAGALGGLLGGLLGGQASMALDDSSTVKGTLRIVMGAPATLTVLVNGTPTPLAVVHARGTLGDLACEFVFLDDRANPLSLKYSYGDNRLQVVRIEFPGDETTASSAPTIAKQLAATGKAEIYGIYFDFASDRIKEESEPVLIEIAKALTDNPTWNLSVDGHTDNIGGDVPNLDLSKRRAAAVRQALVTRYKATAARLTTDGFGASRPKDTNATLEGRARNRRVELIRKSAG